MSQAAILTTSTHQQETPMATQEQITIANKTSRHSPAVGAKALTPKMVRAYVDKNKGKDGTSILDFGAGRTAMHAQAMVADGYMVLAHEFGDNVDPKVHCQLALCNKYNVVYASNVLNVQSDLAMLNETLKQVKKCMKYGGVFFANYPLSPRKMDGMSAKKMDFFLRKHFKSVKIVCGTNAAPVWLMEI